MKALLILALATLILTLHAAPARAASGDAGREVWFCSATNDGDGGDEGYELRILDSGASLEAELRMIDPAGARAYRTIAVATATLNGRPGFVGEGFALELKSDLPKSPRGYTRARVTMPDEAGLELKQAVFCGFRGSRRG